MIAPRLLFALVAVALAGSPDEGQWLPGQVREMDWDALRQRGLQLSKDELWHPERGGVLSAAVRFGGGCSASFVSPHGLVATNHHCGFDAVNKLSTTDNNRLRDGYVAETLADELPCPGVTVSIVRRIVDVTPRVYEAQAKAETDVQRAQLTQKVMRDLVAEGEKEPHTQCRVASFFEGREYHLIYQTVLSDVRLVYAPPRAIGEFGGEVDNWEWPRHTGDFSLFRAYAAPDGSPRAHQKDNVPYQPQHFLRVCRDGVREGDLVMVLGYPGRTVRYLTADAIADRAGVYYPLRHRVLTEVIAVLERAGVGDEARALRLASTIKSLANVQKNALGMVQGLERNGTVGIRQGEEAQFTAWVDADPERKAKWGSILADMQAVDAAEALTTQKDLLLRLFADGRLLPLLQAMITLDQQAPETPATDDAARARLARLGGNAATRDLDSVQTPVLAALLREARLLPEAERIAGTEWLFADPDASIETLTKTLLESPFVDGAKRIELAAQGREVVRANDDRLLAFARSLVGELRAMGARDEERTGRRLALGRVWIDAQQAWRGKKFYPDANGTLRVSFANVKGYAPRDGVLYTPHTTVAGILRKETGAEPFASPAALLSAANTRTASRFFDKALGDVPVCFLSDGDTTGGNSGSCVVNGKGELVGLNFDRVFEAVSGDFGWNADRSRNVSVDIRYALWVMEQVLPARRALAELLGE